jgi:hypothetical protein
VVVVAEQLLVAQDKLVEEMVRPTLQTVVVQQPTQVLAAAVLFAVVLAVRAVQAVLAW